MTFQVDLQPRAFDDLDEAYVYLASRYCSKTAASWYRGIVEKMESLSQDPNRCGLARESVKLEDDIRQLLYRRYRNVHRILFTVRDNTVRILCIRHSSRKDASTDDLDEED